LSINNHSSGNSEIDQIKEIAQRFGRGLSSRGSGLYLLILVALLGLWLASGIYIVEPAEEGVVQTFGRFTAITTSGLNYHVPRPIQRVTIVDVGSVRRFENGFRSSGSDRGQEELDEALMLTVDENIVQVELLVQYRVTDSAKFVFNVQNPEDVLRTSAEVSLRSTVGEMTIDDVITGERARVQEETKARLSALMEQYDTGIFVTNVQLQVADPPAEVRDAFQEVVRALADRERLINEAQAYQNDIVPRARGEKQRAIEEASAFKDQSILRATGDAARFLSVLNAYRVAPEVTRERMHIEALEQILRNVKLILVDQNALGEQVVPFLPLDELNGSAAPSLAPSPSDTSTTEQGGD
jgi:membrane protease subunit HflK